MSIAKQLCQLQEVDIELDGAEKTVQRITRRIEQSEALTAARIKLAAQKQRLIELSKRQRSLEIDLGGTDTRLKKIEEELFSGRVRNQKELAALQREDESLKSDRGRMESQDLLLMEQAEQAGKDLKSAEAEYQAVNAGWEEEKIKLTVELERAKAVLAEVILRRQRLAAAIDPSVITVYHNVKKTRGNAVVPVDKGFCSGCRIALSVADLQKVRGEQLVRCGSCGRIVYLK